MIKSIFRFGKIRKKFQDLFIYLFIYLSIYLFIYLFYKWNLSTKKKLIYIF